MALQAVIYGQDGDDQFDVEPLKLDGATNFLVGIDGPHAEIHEGEGYLLIYSALADNTEDIEVRVQTPDTTKWPHIKITSRADNNALSVVLDYYEHTSN